ncbi:MAG: thiamine pyrophosphate-binding protein [Chloroflexi bacterium]|nr:thiamine pyrophosphate-binding protein [Chloroflexota bacterium]
MSGAQAVVRSLEAEGVDTVFALPGVQIMPLFDALHASRQIRLITCRHEQTTTYAADGYARVTGKPGVCTAASGPGTLNLLTGIYTAFVDCAPMVIVGGAGPVHEIGRDAFQEVDQIGVLRPVTKYCHRPTMAARYPEIVSTAYRQALSGRPGPAPGNDV